MTTRTTITYRNRALISELQKSKQKIDDSKQECLHFFASSNGYLEFFNPYIDRLELTSRSDLGLFLIE